MRRTLPALLLAATLAGCGGNTSSGRYVGDVTPEAAGRACEATRGLLQLDGTHFLFTPAEGVIVIQGTRDQSGALHGSATFSGASHQAFVMSFQGKLTGETISGELVTPRCRSRVALALIQRGLGEDVLRN
ncbi:MAG TPA: hypothetical protein VME92_14750 [Acetobacteraceae bacterium]|nr:hypothetical protein [Acetobacteraceae bacterium]